MKTLNWQNIGNYLITVPGKSFLKNFKIALIIFFIAHFQLNHPEICDLARSTPMFMTKPTLKNEAPIQTSYWSYCLAVVSTFLLADLFSGVYALENALKENIENTYNWFVMYVRFGGYALAAPPGARIHRFYSYHKL